MKDSELRELAKARVEFREHLWIYVLVNVFMIIINLWFSPMFFWFPFVLIFWGIGLLAHFREAYMGTKTAQIDKEFRKLKAKGK
jgi:hypothetical protein